MRRHHLAMADNPPGRIVPRVTYKKGSHRGQVGRNAAAPRPSFGVIITNPHRAVLTALAERFGVSYLRIDHDGAWNKSLAFNTAFRQALSSLPAVSHVI